MTVSTSPKILVIRCSVMDGFDPAVELDRVLERRGKGWFGKYGAQIFSRMEKLKGVTLVLAGHKKGEARLPCYKIEEAVATAPSDSSSFPAYYATRMNRIGTWLLVSQLPQATVDIHDLVIKSSRSPLIQAMGRSMRGHFWCSRTGNN